MRHLFELRDLGVEMIERETCAAALKLGETALAVATQDPTRASRAAQAFAEHDHVVQAKLYAVHKSEPDAHITVSNELRDQLKRTLAEDEAEVKGKLAP
jgi:glutathione-regulated potassium-efflux system ancillary protein KefC